MIINTYNEIHNSINCLEHQYTNKKKLENNKWKLSEIRGKIHYPNILQSVFPETRRNGGAVS